MNKTDLPTLPQEESKTSFLNVAAYKFVTLTDLPARRERLKLLTVELGLRGTILLSPEGINLFIAGERAAVYDLLTELQSDPEIRALEVKESYSSHQPFNRMLVKLKREIIAFGVDGVEPAERTSPKLSAKELQQWLDEGRQVRLLDVRNDYEFELGSFDNAEAVGVDHFRDFPSAAEKLPEDWKEEPVVMFCTGGIRCEKAGPLLENLGFEQVYQLDGGILKYFEECGSRHYRGDCFVFDKRVAVDPDLKETDATMCFACQAVLTSEEVSSPEYVYEISCPRCFATK